MSQQRKVLKVFGFTIDPARCALQEADHDIKLRPKSFDVLHHLVLNAGRLVRREELINTVWPGVIVTEESVTQCVSEVRQALSDQEHKIIKTVARRGYLFAAPVEQIICHDEPYVRQAPSSPTKQELERVPIRCSKCGAVNYRSAGFSCACGACLMRGSPPPAGTHPEQRPLTFLFCDLTSPIARSGGLDPEDLSEVTSAYHARINDVIVSHGGVAVRFQSDGVLTYFGYPQADETDAERAVRAGLAVIEAVGNLRGAHKFDLVARIGIATGLVIIGRRDTDGADVIGEAPTLARRLSAAAEPSAVVIASSTQALVKRLFEYRDLVLEFPGIADPVPALQVVGASGAASRFEALHQFDASALVGREEEMELLLRRWDQVKLGEGWTVLLSGEPGIGKSRVAETLLTRLQGQPHALLRYFCSPHHSHSPLYPFISQLERAASFEPGSGTGARLDKLEALIRRTAKNVPQDLALIAELLEVPSDGRFPPLEVSSQMKREMTLRALLHQLEGLAAQSSLVIVFEDVHWIDPTSLDLLDRTVARVAELPVLMIVAIRPEFQPTWVGQPHVTMLPLNRLGRRESEGIIGGVAKGKALPAAVVQQILARADGVPLFIEELTSALLESDILSETDDGYRLDGPLPPLAIPTTLHASLLSRLDRLSPMKDIVQIGAAIGREFSYELIALLSGLAPEDLDVALERLTASGLITRLGPPPAAIYSFKHALVHDAAYSTLLKSQRQQLHASIAKVLVERYPAQVEGQSPSTVAANPEVLAQHYAAANMIEPAILHWEVAGKKAAERSANVEAAAHFADALLMLRRLPDSTERARRELSLEVKRGSQLLVTKGNAAPQVEEVFTRACELSEQLGEHHLLFRALYGLWAFCIVRGQLERAQKLGERLIERAELTDDRGLLLQAKRPLGLTLCYLGKFATAKATLEEALRLYDPAQHQDLRFEYGSDPAVVAQCNLAWTEWFLGLPDSAVAHSRQAIDRAVQLDHPHSLGWALSFEAAIRQARGEPIEAFDAAEQAISVGNSYRFPYWSAWGRMLRGWAIGRLERLDEGVAEIQQGLADYRATGAELMRPHGLMLLAETVAAAGNPQHALNLLDEASVIVSTNKILFYEPELHRLRGEFLLALNQENAKAVDHFRNAVDLARERGAQALELRALLSLASATRGAERLTALEKLSNLSNQAVEGFGTSDFTSAARLLNLTTQ